MLNSFLKLSLQRILIRSLLAATNIAGIFLSLISCLSDSVALSDTADTPDTAKFYKSFPQISLLDFYLEKLTLIPAPLWLLCNPL